MNITINDSSELNETDDAKKQKKSVKCQLKKDLNSTVQLAKRLEIRQNEVAQILENLSHTFSLDELDSRIISRHLEFSKKYHEWSENHEHLMHGYDCINQPVDTAEYRRQRLRKLPKPNPN